MNSLAVLAASSRRLHSRWFDSFGFTTLRFSTVGMIIWTPDFGVFKLLNLETANDLCMMSFIEEANIDCNLAR